MKYVIYLEMCDYYFCKTNVCWTSLQKDAMKFSSKQAAQSKIDHIIESTSFFQTNNNRILKILEIKERWVQKEFQWD